MIRHGEAANVIRLRKISADENCADIFTKCLTSEAFRRNRARVLGIPYTPVESPAAEAPELTPEPLPRIRPREGDGKGKGGAGGKGRGKGKDKGKGKGGQRRGRRAPR